MGKRKRKGRKKEGKQRRGEEDFFVMAEYERSI